MWTWSDGSNAFTNWADGEPNNWDGVDERYVIMNCCDKDAPQYDGGFWFDSPDWSDPYPLCMRVNGYGTSTFFLSTDGGMSHADAAQYCVDAGGELAIIRSVAEQNDATAACGARTCWIGLAEVGGDALTGEDYQVWQWSDGTSPFTNWAQGEPNNYGGNDERYVIMDYFGNGGGGSGTTRRTITVSRSAVHEFGLRRRLRAGRVKLLGRDRRLHGDQ